MHRGVFDTGTTYHTTTGTDRKHPGRGCAALADFHPAPPPMAPPGICKDSPADGQTNSRGDGPRDREPPGSEASENTAMAARTSGWRGIPYQTQQASGRLVPRTGSVGWAMSVKQTPAPSRRMAGRQSTTDTRLREEATSQPPNGAANAIRTSGGTSLRSLTAKIR